MVAETALNWQDDGKRALPQVGNMHKVAALLLAIRSRGHFLGFWARLNCENMPVIPAWLVRRYLDDPRKIPYLLVWKDEIHGGEIKEAVRLARYVEPSDSRVTDNCVELKRTDGSLTVLRIDWRTLPRNGGWATHAYVLMPVDLSEIRFPAPSEFRICTCSKQHRRREALSALQSPQSSHGDVP